MTEALIFYRTPTTRIIDIADPHSLPAGQRLNFTLPNNIWQHIEEDFKLNNKKFPIPTPKGAIKKIGFSPAGLKSWSRIIRGYFKDPATGVTQLKVFRKLQQIDSYHEFGVFGMTFKPEEAAGHFDEDPDNTFGWSFDGYTLKNMSQLSNKVYDFAVPMSFAGTVP